MAGRRIVRWLPNLSGGSSRPCVWEPLTRLGPVRHGREVQQAAEPWRLGHRPALDGLRGLAILLVLVAHFTNPPGVRPAQGGGLLGVTLFFVLSGFLITALLLEERTRTGSISFGAFYRRRARRLFPALFVMLATASLVQTSGVWLGVGPGNVAAAALYYANWWGMSHPQFTAIQHTWSLSVEEQFYVLWPIVLMAVSRWRRGVLVAAGVGFLASVALMPIVAQPAVNSSTRAASLLAGCAVAAWMHTRPEGEGRPLGAATLLTLMAPLVILEVLLPQAPIYLVAAPVACAAVMWMTAQGQGLRWLTSRWLRYVGRRSYGLYVWHALFLLAGWDLLPGWPWWAKSVASVAVTFVAAELSWRLVEAPMLRKGRALRRPTSDDAFESAPAQPRIRHHELVHAAREGRGALSLPPYIRVALAVAHRGDPRPRLGMTSQPAQLGATGPPRHLQGVENHRGAHVRGDSPAHDHPADTSTMKRTWVIQPTWARTLDR